MSLSWGKPKIWLGKLGADDTAPSNWTLVPTPVEDSTHLNPTKGDVEKAKVEGGGIEGTRVGANEYEFVFDIRALKGREKPVEDENGIIDGSYALKLQPEDASCEGLVIDKGTLSMMPSYDSKGGVVWRYTLNVEKAPSGDDVKFEVVTAPATSTT